MSIGPQDGAASTGRQSGDAAPAASATGAAPAASATGAAPAASPANAAPAVSTTHAAPAVSATDAARAVSATSPSASATRSTATLRLADGQWHRLHPATPLLRGGFAFVAILGFVVLNLRDVLIQLVIGGPDYGQDPVEWVVSNGYAAGVLGIIAVGLLLFIAGFYVSWRMHTFRITDELVEVRSGILFRTNRRGRLDRIQGVNMSRPFLARLFGAAKLEVNVAGHDANVQLAYLGSNAADELRREILLLASGTRSEAAPAAAGASGSLLEKRARELLAPELDPDLAPVESVVQMHLGRLLGSLLLSNITLALIIIAIAIITFISTTGRFFLLFALVPTIIGMFSYYFRRFTRSVRYSIAATDDGIRIGFGLLSTSNETLPPGRIHAIEVRQPLLWRPFGWWEIRINRAASSTGRGGARQAETTVLPVGNRADVRKVMALVLPGLDDATAATLESGMTGRGTANGFTSSPRRAVVLRPFSWRRNAFALTEDLVLLRRGAVWRQLDIVPRARLQSLGLHQGPLQRWLRLASIRLHTVAGPVDARLGAIDAAQATTAFGEIAAAAVRSAGTDTSHRWRVPGVHPLGAQPLTAQAAPPTGLPS